jgi:hypothetical protein
VLQKCDAALTAEEEAASAGGACEEEDYYFEGDEEDEDEGDVLAQGFLLAQQYLQRQSKA